MRKYIIIDMENVTYYDWEILLEDYSIDNCYLIFVNATETMAKESKKRFLKTINMYNYIDYVSATPGKESADMMCSFIAGSIHTIDPGATIVLLSDDTSFKSLDRNLKTLGICSVLISVPSHLNKTTKIATLHEKLLTLGFYKRDESRTLFSKTIDFIKLAKFKEESIIENPPENHSDRPNTINYKTILNNAKIDTVAECEDIDEILEEDAILISKIDKSTYNTDNEINDSLVTLNFK